MRKCSESYDFKLFIKSKILIWLFVCHHGINISEKRINLCVLCAVFYVQHHHVASQWRKDRTKQNRCIGSVPLHSHFLQHPPPLLLPPPSSSLLLGLRAARGPTSCATVRLFEYEWHEKYPYQLIKEKVSRAHRENRYIDKKTITLNRISNLCSTYPRAWTIR